jgi:membrane protease YdiL (CAAX protease family)
VNIHSFILEQHMNVPVQLIVLTLPSLIYAGVRRTRGDTWSDVLNNLGWRGSPARYFLWSAGIFVALEAFGWLALRAVPAEILHDPRIGANQYAGWTLDVGSFVLILLREAFYVALGEEIFFRGFLGGWLVRRFGFPTGNTVQAFAFLLPHLLLLLVSRHLWPLVAMSSVVHSVANATAASVLIK